MYRYISPSTFLCYEIPLPHQVHSIAFLQQHLVGEVKVLIQNFLFHRVLHVGEGWRSRQVQARSQTVLWGGGQIGQIWGPFMITRGLSCDRVEFGHFGGGGVRWPPLTPPGYGPASVSLGTGGRSMFYKHLLYILLFCSKCTSVVMKEKGMYQCTHHLRYCTCKVYTNERADWEDGLRIYQGPGGSTTSLSALGVH